MIYVKTYEGFFDFFKKKEKKEVDIETLKDLLLSDLESIEFKHPSYKDSYEVLDEIFYIPQRYESDRRGNPILKEESHPDGGKKIMAANPPDRGTGQHGILKSEYDKKIAKSEKSPIGIVAYIGPANHSYGMVGSIGIRSAIFTYDHINKERMKSYGIGCVLFNDDRNYGILFYNL